MANHSVSAEHAKTGAEPLVPLDIHDKAKRGFANWKESRAASGKPITTDLPNPWRRKRRST